MEKIIIQITAGKGSVECCRVVARVQKWMLVQARKIGIEMEQEHHSLERGNAVKTITGEL